MSVAIDLSGANSYFAPRNHLQAEVWKGFGADQQAGAIAHASRLISRELGKEVADETVDASIYYHPDRAVYEQALYMLKNSFAIPNAQQTAPHFTAVDMGTGRASPKAADPDELCAEAARFLIRPRRQIYLVRG